VHTTFGYHEHRAVYTACELPEDYLKDLHEKLQQYTNWKNVNDQVSGELTFASFCTEQMQKNILQLSAGDAL